MVAETKYSWIEPYKAIASELRTRRDQENILLELASGICDLGGAKRIDPLTFMAMFNRGQKELHY